MTDNKTTNQYHADILRALENFFTELDTIAGKYGVRSDEHLAAYENITGSPQDVYNDWIQEGWEFDPTDEKEPQTSEEEPEPAMFKP